MADPNGFLRHHREAPTRRPVDVRIQDWREVYEPFPLTAVQTQATRCMDCGIPFCHNGCPLGNLIPEWNDQARRGHWDEAIERLHATNNFPEFTGRLCPAPCEAACVLGLGDDPVSIKQVEASIIDRAWAEGAVRPQPPSHRTGRRVAVIGSGPAGLAAAQQLTRAGHDVTVYERADRIGGLMRYGIPEFKMEKSVLDRRLRQMRAEGTSFVTECEVGIDVRVGDLKESYDAIVIATGSTIGRGLGVPGGDLPGVHLAMDYLPQANMVQEGDSVPDQILATGKHVVIIGGGDTGADCLGTAHRQSAASVLQLEIMPMPPESRDPSTPWPLWPLMMRSGSAHEEGGERVFAVNTSSLSAGPDGRVAQLHLVEVGPGFTPIEGTERTIPAELVLLAMGFTGPERPVLEQFGLALDGRGNVARTEDYATSVEGIFVCGDAGRGQSLIVWAIAEGRSAARSVDAWLEGQSSLPAPLAAARTLEASAAS